MVTYEQACDIVAAAFPGAVFSSAYEYPGGWYFNVEPSGWMEDQPVNPFGVGTAVVILDQEKVTRRTACTVQSSASWQSRPTSSST